MSFLTSPYPGIAAVYPDVPKYQWAYVQRRFAGLLANLNLTASQFADGDTKHKGVVNVLNRAYWGDGHDTANRLLAGSWGKSTRVRPPRDIDILFLPPLEIFYQFRERAGNCQSQLLQDVAGVLRESYSQTTIRGDGQVVVVDFKTYRVEVAPAFRYQPGGYLICDTNDGGRWKHVDPEAEINAIHTADQVHGGNVRKLSRILKQWQRECNVPIKSFQIEAIVREIIPSKYYGKYDEFWFDWLIRDAFSYLISRANGGFWMPGCANEWIELGNGWLSKAQSAYSQALKACEYERDNQEILAGIEWQKIFGTMVPMTVA